MKQKLFPILYYAKYFNFLCLNILNKMAFEDFLIPGEEVRFRSSTHVSYGKKDYQVVVTNKRILLYAQRGMVIKKDDLVMQKLDELNGVKFKESGLLKKIGTIDIDGKTKMQLSGPSAEVKTLYQQIMQFV